MAPPSQSIRLPNIVYSTPIISGEMDVVNSLIDAKKAEIASLSEHMTIAQSELVTLQYQLMVLYIQQTGSFPS